MQYGFSAAEGRARASSDTGRQQVLTSVSSQMNRWGLGDRLSVYKARGFFVPWPFEIVTQATRCGCNDFHAFKERLVASARERCYI